MVRWWLISVVLMVCSSVLGQIKIDSVFQDLRMAALPQEKSSIPMQEYLGPCNGCKVDSTSIITYAPDYTRIIGILDKLLDNGCSISDIEPVKVTYSQVVKRIDSNFDNLFSNNSIHSLTVKCPQIDLMALTMARFENLLYFHDACLLSDTDFYSLYLSLDSVEYDVLKGDYTQRLEQQDNFIFSGFKGDPVFGFGNYYLYRLKPQVVSRHLLQDLRSFEWQSEDTTEAYNRQAAFVRRQHYILSLSYSPELQDIFADKWTNWISNDKLWFMLNSCHSIDNHRLIRSIVDHVLQADRQLADIAIRHLYLKCLDKEYMGELIVQEARKRIGALDNPALDYTRLFFSDAVIRFYIEALTASKVPKESKMKIHSMLVDQYDRLLQRVEMDEDFYFSTPQILR